MRETPETTSGKLSAGQLLGWTAGWRLIIADRVSRLEVAVEQVAGPPETVLKAISDGIKQARIAARLDAGNLHPIALIGQWLTGSSIESAWRGLHRAEEWFVLVAPVEWVECRMDETEATLEALGLPYAELRESARRIKETKPSQALDSDRQLLKSELEQTNVKTDNLHSNVRTLRNILIAMTALLLIGLGVMAVVAALSPEAFSLCGASSGAQCSGAPGVLEVELAGGFGGLLSAVFFLRNLQTQNGPYAIWLFQGLLKAPTGAALALVLVFLVQTGLIGALRAGPAYVIPYALVFGFAQQAATQLIDSWAAGVTKAASPERAKPSGRRDRA